LQSRSGKLFLAGSVDGVIMTVKCEEILKIDVTAFFTAAVIL
jgi:hypothetical protein